MNKIKSLLLIENSFKELFSIKKIKELLVHYKEIILYLVFGVLTTLVNWLTYSILVKFLSVNMNVSNVTAWIAGVLFAYITNRIFVFESKTHTLAGILKEFWLFVLARGVTGVLEIGGLPLLVKLGLNQTIFGVEGFLAKIIISVVVVILNYVFSKLIIFRKKEKADKK